MLKVKIDVGGKSQELDFRDLIVIKPIEGKTKVHLKNGETGVVKTMFPDKISVYTGELENGNIPDRVLPEDVQNVDLDKIVIWDFSDH